MLGSALAGMCICSHLVAESSLVLKYAARNDREKYFGRQRLAMGLGIAITPVIVTLLLTFIAYWACFLFTALVLLSLVPFIHYRLVDSR